MLSLGKLDKRPPALIGLLQATGVMTYIAVFVLVVNSLESTTEARPPEFVTAGFVLLTFVFSALVCGSLVLGYPTLLALKGQVRRAVAVVAWTGLSFAAVLALALIFLVALV